MTDKLKQQPELLGQEVVFVQKKPKSKLPIPAIPEVKVQNLILIGDVQVNSDEPLIEILSIIKSILIDPDIRSYLEMRKNSVVTGTKHFG